jgi:sugar lactone lactonase YvrE
VSTSFRNVHRAKTKAFFRRFLAAASFATASATLSAHAAPGDLYATDSSSGSSTAIVKFTPQGVKTTFASGLSLAIGLAFDSSGNLFVTQSSGITNGDTVLKFTPDGTKSTFASGLNGPEGLAFDSSGNLFVTEFNTGTILKFTPSGAQSTFTSSLSSPTALAFDFSGNMFVGDGSIIVKFTPTGSKTTFTSESPTVEGLAFDGSGNLFTTNQGDTPSVLKFTRTGTKSTFASSGLFSPAGLAFDNSGNLFVADINEGSIFKFTPGGTKSTFVSGLVPDAIAFEPLIQKLRNVSTRGMVGTGSGVLIGGFILGGNQVATNAVVVRALGPTLTGFGVAGALQDPTLLLVNSSGVTVATNNNWKNTQQSQIQATGLAPPDDRESAIYAILPAGNYTAIVAGINNTTGIALVEVYLQ